MSGRPYVSVEQWASGNYPAGGSPWSGQPKTSAPGYSGFVPDQVIPAEELNYVLASIKSQANQGLTDLLEFTGNLPVNNLRKITTDSSFGAVSINTPRNVKYTAWGPAQEQQYAGGTWLCLYSDTASHAFLARSSDNGYTWEQISDPSSIISNSIEDASGNGIGCQKMCVLPSGNILFPFGLPTNQLRKYTLSTGAWSNQATGISNAFSGVIRQYDTNGNWLTNILMGALTFESDASGSSFTSLAIPGALSGTGNWTGDCTEAGRTFAFPLSSSTQYMYRDYGGSWTLATGPNSGGFTVQACSYDSVNKVFYLLTNNGTDSKIFIGSTTNVWLPVQTYTGRVFTDLVMLGSLMVLAQTGGGTGATAQPCTICYSVDGGNSVYLVPNFRMNGGTNAMRLGAARNHKGACQLMCYRDATNNSSNSLVYLGNMFGTHRGN